MASSLGVISEPDSQCLAELSTMFPNIEYNVLVSILQENNGQMDATVEYFLTNLNPNANSLELESAHFSESHSQEDMIMGQFSEDIGGLPEMLPGFIFDAQDTQSASDEDSSVTHSRSPSPDSNINSDDDPLPTYDQACTDQDRLPEAVYVEDDLVAEGENTITEEASPITTAPTHVQSKKYKKARKLAERLKNKKFKIKLAKGKKSGHSISAREGYVALGSDQAVRLRSS